MYMTEQFCKGDKYMKLKNRDLIQKATKSNRVDLEKEAQRKLKRMLDNESSSESSE